ncbi:CCAAT/enhancer-binding protein zeta-like [Saccostrea echinata]|uniref:CCAAT/enhancer-binding protein zeta-like n=1 Tax=Saccostrea echinata TaxID=191078 RepID=UPI002A841D78|nr:CCAAT/enhancer-binding protein zeta-like [Saccostrea echinata]
MASKKKVKTRVKDVGLDIKTVSELGGDKNDVQLLEGIDENDEELIEEFDEGGHEDGIRRDEILDFIKKLGIPEQFAKDEPEEDRGKEKKKKKKLAVMPEAEENDMQEKSTAETKKKKQKNKYKIQHEEISSTTSDLQTIKGWSLKTHLSSYTPRSFLLIKPGQRSLEEEDSEEGSSLSSDLEKQLESFASKLLEDEVSVYLKQREKSKKSETKWIKTVLTTGTLTDKVAALTLLVQESPVHNLQNLEGLVNMCRKKNKRESMIAADTLKDLFITNLLPDRKLRLFDQHPLGDLGDVSGGNKDTIDRKLLKWLYEHRLKEKYSSFIQALEVMSKDNILATRQKALGIFFQLLAEKPEEEKVLLALLVNKVGDPEYKVAAQASHLLTKLVDKHPNMKMVVTKEVEQLLYRPNIPVKAQYYCICFINRLLLSHEEKDLAVKLIRLYFSFFKSFVNRGEIDSKMMSALLSGVNRAYPYAKMEADYISDQMNTLYKIIHTVNFNTSVQALMLIYQVMDSSENISDRYYVALYKKLLEPELKNTAKQAMFLNLLFKSMKKDSVERRVKAFVKRLLQVCSYQPVQFVCGALVLLGELMKVHKGILTLDHTTEEDSDDEEHYEDLPAPDESEADDTSSSESSDSEDEQKGAKSKVKSSWVHKNLKNSGFTKAAEYDPQHRNPLYCRADSECVWELQKLSQHFHPTVSLFASNLLKGEHVRYTGDPLQDFTIIRFLDRFVYKNPKKPETFTEMQGTLSRSKFNTKTTRLKGVKKVPVSSEEYLQKAESYLPAEEIFYHRFFKQKAEKERKRKELEEEEEESDEEVSDTEFDEYLDTYEKQFEGGDIGGNFSGSDIDFASAVGMKATKKGKLVMESDDEDVSEEEDDDMDLSDEEMNFEHDEDFAKEFQEFDADIEDGVEEEASSAEDEFVELTQKKRALKHKVKSAAVTVGNKKMKKSDKFDSNLFASADEFADMIEESAGSGWDTLGSSALSNQDKSSAKQLKWEMERDSWIKGKNKNLRNKKQRGKGKQSFKQGQKNVKKKR